VLSWKDFVAPAEVGTAMQYFAMLALLWLAGGLAMAAGRTGWASLALPVGIAVGVVLRVGLDLSLVGAQSAGILTAAAIAALAALTTARKGYRRVRTPLAHPSVLVALVLVGTAIGGVLFGILADRFGRTTPAVAPRASIRRAARARSRPPRRAFPPSAARSSRA